MVEDPDFTEATIWPCEGARVGAVSCKHCGAAIFVDPRADRDYVELHRQWHELHAPVIPVHGEIQRWFHGEIQR